MWIYAGMFWIALATLVFEITLTRLFSVITWYYLAFFAVAVAMLGMTAGAVRVYLYHDRLPPERLPAVAADACVGFTLSVPVALAVLCLVPAQTGLSGVCLAGMLVSTVACALPFFFSGTAVALLLTRHWLPVGRLYASDLAGASLGCLFVLAALGWLDAPSLLLLAGAIGALAGWCLLAGHSRPARRHRVLALAVVAGLLALLNASPRFGLRPQYVKGQCEPRGGFLFEAWNSFSRVAVFPGVVSPPQLWGPSPATPPLEPILQYHMNIDGDAGTGLRAFHRPADIDHLRYDVTSIVHALRPSGDVCVIGVGGARDIQGALLFGHERVLGIELNPIFVDLLQGFFRDVAGIVRPGVTLVVDEARGYLTRSTASFRVVQMSLIDTWAATGAGAFSLSENGLYTVEAWKVFLNRLSDDGIFTVSRWHGEKTPGETGRMLSLAVSALYEMGAQHPRDHIALVTAGRISTLLVRRTPFDAADLRRLQAACADLQFEPVAMPGAPARIGILETILGASSTDDLARRVRDYPLNYCPPRDDSPYFFNMLRLRTALGGRRSVDIGVVEGNLKATAALLALIGVLAVLTLATIVVPLALGARLRSGEATDRRWLRAGGLYFSLIGTGFMLLEIALIQRLSLYLSHPVHALGVLLFSLIAATGIGSFLSGRLPLTRRPWLYLCPPAMAALILASHFAVGKAIAATIVWSQIHKICLAVVLVAPLGVCLGFFFPTGMRLFREAGVRDTSWFWAMNGIFGVLSSAVAVFISLFLGISVNFYLAAACYLALLPVLLLLPGGKGAPAPVTAPAPAGSASSPAGR